MTSSSARSSKRSPLNSSLRRIIALVSVLALTSALFAADTARRGATETALDRYIAKADSSFAWKKVAEVRDDAATGYSLDMVSQQWLTPAEVNRTEWRHWVNIIKPDNLAHSTALLFINGGSNRPGPAPKPAREFAELAKATRSVVVELRMVPNQTLIFDNDGKERKEDDLIAYTWDKYLRTGDERWPARLPMTKAAVRAMDSATSFLASAEGGSARVDTFMVAGASKRGWTTWTTAIVDRRVIGILPMVIDILGVEASISHHHRAYGFYAPAVGDYSNHHIMDWLGTRESKALYAIEDPLSYKDRLSLPKLMMNACGDQFFLPDSSQFYFDQLPGPKYLRYIPNTDHSLKNTDAMDTLRAWHHALLNRTPLPEVTWKHDRDGSVVVKSNTKPQSVLFWQATNPNARDFRLESFGPGWTSTPVAEKNGAFHASPANPEKGWTASMVELTFDIGAGVPLKLTTNVVVTPDTLPFFTPNVPRPIGFLSK